MLPENITAVVARNERWSGHAATEPYEAGWAREIIIFVRALKAPTGQPPAARVQISPDGIHWADEGSTLDLPSAAQPLAFVRVAHFGNFVRLAADFADGADAVVLVTIHAKA
ncbi:hypothetical protein RDV64_19610 [Acuticoccus sp. MNP-M23]|uniref:hypothetical protein n=1 Tax=Acuticoccus sp. MNP-M23 TaxID=3072793 RepID=UPI0028155830|nr:hypothetical protein [Acuticoccus sp. MNP-M23]WMS42248.1 hypothetical protein RDV64_19610 [Acuticoccus sp. MNP-M23]